jgi:hypothetical protein
VKSQNLNEWLDDYCDALDRTPNKKKILVVEPETDAWLDFTKGEKAYGRLGRNFILERFFRRGKDGPGMIFHRGKFSTRLIFPGGGSLTRASFSGGKSLCYNTGTHVPQWDSNKRRKDYYICATRATQEICMFLTIYCISFLVLGCRALYTGGPRMTVWIWINN